MTALDEIVLNPPTLGMIVRGLPLLLVLQISGRHREPLLLLLSAESSGPSWRLRDLDTRRTALIGSVSESAVVGNGEDFGVRLWGNLRGSEGALSGSGRSRLV